jgi:hypothetical protein
MGLDTSIATIEGLAQDVLRGWEMNWEGQRVYAKAVADAARIEAASGKDAVWNLMSVGEQMQTEGDRLTVDAEVRAEAADIDMLGVLYVAEQLLDAKRLQ